MSRNEMLVFLGALAFAVIGLAVAGRVGAQRASASAAYTRGYAAAVDSVMAISAPVETLRVVVRRGESVLVSRPLGKGGRIDMQVYP